MNGSVYTIGAVIVIAHDVPGVVVAHDVLLVVVVAFHQGLFEKLSFAKCN